MKRFVMIQKRQLNDGAEPEITLHDFDTISEVEGYVHTARYSGRILDNDEIWILDAQLVRHSPAKY